ncbi:hypothetical protein BKA70DRAFT_1224308 [Coprinopsis sp. MPI-PUGE-AT-0042]|nr:hypothetical protein BKA70DRAFT_1224308 [Coprinopsis sp. MPI-PUGE-AT-0042]
MEITFLAIFTLLLASTTVSASPVPPGPPLTTILVPPPVEPSCPVTVTKTSWIARDANASTFLSNTVTDFGAWWACRRAGSAPARKGRIPRQTMNSTVFIT